MEDQDLRFQRLTRFTMAEVVAAYTGLATTLFASHFTLILGFTSRHESNLRFEVSDTEYLCDIIEGAYFRGMYSRFDFEEFAELRAQAVRKAFEYQEELDDYKNAPLVRKIGPWGRERVRTKKREVSKANRALRALYYSANVPFYLRADNQRDERSPSWTSSSGTLVNGCVHTSAKGGCISRPSRPLQEIHGYPPVRRESTLTCEIFSRNKPMQSSAHGEGSNTAFGSRMPAHPPPAYTPSSKPIPFLERVGGSPSTMSVIAYSIAQCSLEELLGGYHSYSTCRATKTGQSPC
ncbi:hypothetical protein CYLTODRAFT_425549 [Cylindrobasidium torrendii FP15055 ss-10]|uniref:Uncharacterized protein n=1 Tax=Cylindrobasidium torrendii FP15055 ss-10 TaxID=1314674 RepID=A0A0D7B1N5_9AGAR|nr:hypothetical protein CYLTODRAFT_425549 [Cylindrobasidium torrendii FP15055 ss-10]